MIDALNQIFVEFELVYHNQYHKAFPTLEKLQYAKQLWFSNFEQYTPEQILHAAHRAVKESEYLPTIRGLLKYCEGEFALYGLPDARSAYIEACQAPSPKSECSWSHPAVYHAGIASDWFFLANNIEKIAFPIFERNYRLLCERVRNGESLNLPITKALPESLPATLSKDEQLQKIRGIRKKLKI